MIGLNRSLLCLIHSSQIAKMGHPVRFLVTISQEETNIKGMTYSDSVRDYLRFFFALNFKPVSVLSKIALTPTVYFLSSIFVQLEIFISNFKILTQLENQHNKFYYLSTGCKGPPVKY